MTGAALLFFNLVLDGDRVVDATLRPLYAVRDPVSLLQETEWVPGLVWTDKEISHPPGFDPRNTPPIAIHSMAIAIPAAT
jgi:hypothetical protein